ncbi:MAG: ABC transporter permease [Candidatus Aminicenantes bacterium]|nr:ABC transporter permease [Candidatus Aminicenantes bacterium]
MIRNYIKITLRNIFKHKGYSFINIAGLAAGMACCLLIAIWVLDELSYDKFHQNESCLYRVEENQHYSGRLFHVNVTPYPLGPALKEEIAEIADSSRFFWAGSYLLRYGEKAFYENNIRAVDPSFFRMFSFPVIKGDKYAFLDSPYSLVITEDIATKYFGSENPLGRVILLDNQHEFTVSGVVKNVPHNSTIQFDMLLPYEFLRKEGKTREEDFGSNSILTYVQLKENVTLDQANEKVFGFIRTKSPQSRTDLVLMPLNRIHLHAYFGYEKTMGAIQYVYIFSIIAFFVLFIACINFMNLSTARSAKRAREVGMRKVVGALKTHLIRQFYGESLLFAMIALIFAIILVTLLLPPFSSLAGKDLSWNVMGISNIMLGLMGITLFTGLVAGSYPALVLSSFHPVKVIRGGHRSKRGGIMFRRILVVLQFSLSILLIIGTVVVYKQLNYMKNVRLGWDKEHLLSIPLRADIQKSYQSLKDELIKDARILGVSGTSQLPSHIGSNSGGVDWDGKDPQQQILIGFNFVDFDFVKTLDIKMVDGRAFSKDFPSDLSQTFIVNEEVVKLMGKESVVGERFHFMGVNGTIVGVMKNFHYQSVQNKIEPLAILVVPNYIRYLLIRIPPENISASLKFIENTWNRVFPNYPFDYQFIDENFDRMYRAEERIGTLLKYFAFLAVLIACLGLFGLASFTAEQRTKEIGIRKVLGASVGQVTFLLCREFFLLVLLSNLIAWPLAYLAMEDWLNNYAYRTNAGIVVFLAAMIAALAVAILSVAFQAIKAALANPANALKYE